MFGRSVTEMMMMLCFPTAPL